MNPSDRLRALLKEKILVLDGAMGTALQGYDLDAGDFGGEAFRGVQRDTSTSPGPMSSGRSIEVTSRRAPTSSRPTRSVRRPSSWPSTRPRTSERMRSPAPAPRSPAERRTPTARPRSLDSSPVRWARPPRRSPSPAASPSTSWSSTLQEQARALIDGRRRLPPHRDGPGHPQRQGGADRDRAMLSRSSAARCPSRSPAPSNRWARCSPGQTAEAFVTSLEHADLLYIGLNCATGPRVHDRPHPGAARAGAGADRCVPNAGLPDEDGKYLETPADDGRRRSSASSTRAGSTSSADAAARRRLTSEPSRVAEGKAAARAAAAHGARYVSGIEFVEITDETAARSSSASAPTSSAPACSSELIAEEKFEEAAEIARAAGARRRADHRRLPGRIPTGTSSHDMERFFDRRDPQGEGAADDRLDRPERDRAGAHLLPGQGDHQLDQPRGRRGALSSRSCPLARQYGAALVVGCIDEDKQQAHGGHARAQARRSPSAPTSCSTDEYGIPPEDIIFDPLVFPCATGDENYVGSARETIEGIRLIKEALPQCKTILGISNVSFGLPPAGREVLNSVFLYHCTKAGLDFAIVNAEKLERYAPSRRRSEARRRPAL